jgi:radical SAM superfamily enzyme YgiQ (UPF0313 family)
MAIGRRDLLAQEQGAVIKEWGGRIPICLVFPNTYYVGMSNLGFQLLYRILNSIPEVVCERAFLPEAFTPGAYTQNNAPLVSLESARPLAEFQIVAFSVPFENDFPNLLSILQCVRIPLRRKERDGSFPLIVAGGAAISLNPEPLALFVDLFFIGEGEEVVIDFLRVFQDVGNNKTTLFNEACRLAGVYCPSLYEASYDEKGRLRKFQPRKNGAAPRRVKRHWLKDVATSGSAILTRHTEFKEMFLMELNRGCPRTCRFCVARTIYAPFRNRQMDKLLQEADRGLSQGKRIGLVGSALGDYPGFNDLCRYIVSKGGTVSVSSLRADTISEECVELLVASRQRTVTMAPETGTERLRAVVAKGLTDEKIFDAVERLARHGIRNLKLYFIIGLPTETSEDIEGIIALVKRIRHHMVKGGKRIGEITLSIAPFIPKAWTPFQWHPFADVKDLKKKLAALKKGAAKIPRCRVQHDLPKWGYVQTLFSMGDRRVAEILMRLLETHGDWTAALRNSPINPDFWVYREKKEDEVFPWDFLDHGMNKDDLWKEYQKALQWYE